MSPTDSDICTGSVQEIHWADNEDSEQSILVNLFPRSALHRAIARQREDLDRLRGEASNGTGLLSGLFAARSVPESIRRMEERLAALELVPAQVEAWLLDEFLLLSSFLFLFLSLFLFLFLLLLLLLLLLLFFLR